MDPNNLNNMNSLQVNQTDNNCKTIKIFRNNQNELKYNVRSTQNKSINTDLPVILKCPPSVNENSLTINSRYSRNEQNIANTHNEINIFSNESIKTVFKQKNYHLNKLKDYLRKNPTKRQTINGSIFNNYDSNKINYIQLSANFNSNKNKSNFNLLKKNIFDNDILNTDFPYTSRGLNHNIYNQINQNNINYPPLPPIENLLKSHLKMYTPRNLPCQKSKNYVKQIYLKTMINKNQKNLSKSLDIKKHKGQIWTTDYKKNIIDESKNNNTLFRNKNNSDKITKCMTDQKSYSIKNKTLEEMKQNNLKKNKMKMEKAFGEFRERKKFISNYLERSKKEFDKFDVCMNKENESCLYDD